MKNRRIGARTGRNRGKRNVRRSKNLRDAAVQVAVESPLNIQPRKPPEAAPLEREAEISVDVGSHGADRISPAPPKKAIDVDNVDFGSRHGRIAKEPTAGFRIIRPLTADDAAADGVVTAASNPAQVDRWIDRDCPDIHSERCHSRIRRLRLFAFRAA